MEKIASYEMKEWPFQDFKYVYDIIDFEGPVLVHYQHNDKNAFYYWVDGDKSHNRWLCFEVSIAELYDYLSQNISLRELISNKRQEPFYTVDIDEKLKYSNFQLILGYALPDIYIPDAESYFIKEVPPFYEKLFSKLDLDGHMEFLKRKAYDLVMTANNSVHQDLLTIDKIGHFLVNLDDSYEAFSGYCFIKKFEPKIKNPEVLLKTARQFVKSNKPLAADNKHGSFHVTMSVDYSDTEGVPVEYMDLRDDILSRFRAEVLDIDLNNDEVVTELLNKYDSFERKKIFGPIIKIKSDSDYNFSIVDKKENRIKTFEKVREYNAKKIAPKKEEGEEKKSANKIFVTLTLEVDASKNLRALSKKELQQATLFSTFEKSINQSFDSITNDAIEVVFSRPIQVKFEHIQDKLQITFEPLDIKTIHQDKDMAFANFVNTFIDIIKRDFLSKTPTNKEYSKYLSGIISEVKD